MVIAASVLVVTVLGTLAKISMRRALDAASAQRSLQQRWGALLLQQALLKRAASIFQEREELLAKIDPKMVPPPYLRDVITMHDVTFDILLGDEDAKLNLNALYHQVGSGEAEAAIHTIVGPTARGAVRLLPVKKPMSLSREQKILSVSAEASDDEELATVDAFRSWGEVFDIAALKTLLGSEAAVANATTGITCWGTGQLNFKRASDEAILAIIGSVVQDGGARRILKRYRQNPAASLPVLLQLEVKQQRQRERLSRLLNQTSTNFSIWIHASSKNDRGLTHFVVSRRDDEGVTRFSKFSH